MLGASSVVLMHLKFIALSAPIASNICCVAFYGLSPFDDSGIPLSDTHTHGNKRVAFARPCEF